MITNHHQSVMYAESIDSLDIKNNGAYIDATFGRGGHAGGILAKLGENGRLIAFDQDPSAIEYAKEKFNDKRLELYHSPFVKMHEYIENLDLMGKVDGIFMDLGVSSPQLDNAERGFSFQQDGPLDMRMDTSSGLTASDWLKTADEKEIADVLYKFGEERKSRQIASSIKRYQQDNELNTTSQLANIISKVIGGKSKKHPATRSFQAIRIFINQELKQLSDTLEQTIDILTPGGILSVISFHSIEDRIVKQFIQKYSKPKQMPKGLPIMNSEVEKTILTNLGKTSATKAELEVNPRSRSAILRVAKKN